jgi:hypothetical protein
MNGPMKLIDAVLGAMQCQVCGAWHGASRHTRYYYAAAWQCSSKQCPTNQEYWDDRKKRLVKPDWKKTAGICEISETA